MLKKIGLVIGVLVALAPSVLKYLLPFINDVHASSFIKRNVTNDANALLLTGVGIVLILLSEELGQRKKYRPLASHFRA